MPNKGQPIVAARLPEELYDAFMALIDDHNALPTAIHWTKADAVVAAIIEMVHQRERRRGNAGPRPHSYTPDPGGKREME